MIEGTRMVSCLAVSSPSYLCTPSLLAGGAERETEKALMLYKHCSTADKTLVCYQPCFGHQSKTGQVLHPTGYCEEN